MTKPWYRQSAQQLWRGNKWRFSRTNARQAWTGAVVSRLHDFVFGWIQSAHQELKGELVTLRARARDLSRNNAYFRRYLALLAENVVGPKGIRLQAQARMRNGELDQNSNDRIELAWKDWGKVGNCDVTGRLSWTEIEGLVIQTVARDGECFIRKVPGFDNKHGYAVQLLDADQFDDTFDVQPGNGKNAVRMGVESDEWGRVVAYWMWTAHPQDATRRERKRIPAREIVHLVRYRRVGQPRGETWAAPVMYGLRLLDGYTEAELVAARTSAAKMGFIQQDADATGVDPDGPTDPTVTEASPGTIDRLGIGEKFVGWDPQHPSGNFGPFVATVLRQVACGLNVSYVALTGDLNSTNYSSGRIGSLQERDFFRMLQSWLSEHLHDLIYREWLRYAMTSPHLKLEDVNLAKYEMVVWRPRGWDWVDPAKDVDANRMAIAAGFVSPAEIIAESGNEIEDVYEEIARSQKLAKTYGLMLDYGTAKPAEPPTKQAPATDEKDDEDEKPTSNGNGRALVLARLTNGRTV
jgi:lambda family phage portal protein